VRRRVRDHPEAGVVPDALSRFVLDEWSGDVSAAFAAWCEARRVWAETHGWPGGEDRRAASEFEAAIRLPDEEWSNDAQT
jgi:hypothetical protein